MYIKTIIFLFSAYLISTFLGSCGCDDPSDPECSNYDPCLGKQETSAYFIIEESIANDIWVECDTIAGRGNRSSVRFTAKHNADSFVWHLGTEIINDKSFIRQSFPPNTWIEVLLVVYNRNPDKVCFPNDDGIDSFKRNLFVWPEESVWDADSQKYRINNPYPIQGTYKGYFVSDLDHEVELSLNDSSCQCNERILPSTIIFNLPKGLFKPYYEGPKCGYFIGQAWASLPLQAFLNFDAYPESNPESIDDDKVIRVSGYLSLARNLKDVDIVYEYFTLNDPNQVLTKDRFIGKRIK